MSRKEFDRLRLLGFFAIPRLTLQVTLLSKYRNDLMKRPKRLCNFRSPSRDCLIDSRRLFIAVTSSTKRICFRQKIPREFKNSGISTPSIDTSRSSGDFKSQHRCQNPRSGLLCCHRQSIHTLNLTLSKIKYANPC